MPAIPPMPVRLPILSKAARCRSLPTAWLVMRTRQKRSASPDRKVDFPIRSCRRDGLEEIVVGNERIPAYLCDVSWRDVSGGRLGYELAIRRQAVEYFLHGGGQQQYRSDACRHISYRHCLSERDEVQLHCRINQLRRGVNFGVEPGVTASVRSDRGGHIGLERDYGGHLLRGRLRPDVEQWRRWVSRAGRNQPRRELYHGHGGG